MYDHIKIEKYNDGYIVTTTTYEIISEENLFESLVDILFEKEEIFNDNFIIDNDLVLFTRQYCTENQAKYLGVVGLLQEINKSSKDWKDYFTNLIIGEFQQRNISMSVSDNIYNILNDIDYSTHIDNIRKIVLDFVKEKQKKIIKDKVDDIKTLISTLSEEEKQEILKGLK